jgi:hypothetical protein
MDEKTRLGRAHAVLQKALRSVPFEERPPEWHVGGPLLTCPAIAQIELSLWCSELLKDRALPGEAKKLARLRSLVRDLVDRPRIDTLTRGPDKRLRD